MPLRVEVEGTLARDEVADLITPFLNGTAQGERILLDLSKISWATPFGLVTLIAFLDHFYPTVSGMRMICPTSDDCRQYLAASGFLQQVPSQIEVVRGENLRLTRPSGADTVLGLTRLHGESDITTASAAVESRLNEMLGEGDPQWRKTKGAVLSTLGELCSNILLHADYDVGWVGAQRYRNRHDGRQWVEFVIADAGQGIRRSLTPAYPDLEELSDGQVIERAIDEELSRLDAPGKVRGTGFYVLKKATREHDGSFYLRSGSGDVARSRRNRRMIRNDGLDAWPGTQLEVAITCG